MIDLIQLVSSIAWFISYGLLACLIACFAACSSTKVLYRTIGMILLSVIAYHGLLYASHVMKLGAQLPLFFYLFSPENVTKDTIILSALLRLDELDRRV